MEELEERKVEAGQVDVLAGFKEDSEPFLSASAHRSGLQVLNVQCVIERS